MSRPSTSFLRQKRLLEKIKRKRPPRRVGKTPIGRRGLERSFGRIADEVVRGEMRQSGPRNERLKRQFNLSPRSAREYVSSNPATRPSARAATRLELRGPSIRPGHAIKRLE